MSSVNESQATSPLAVSSYRYPTGWFVVAWSSDGRPGTSSGSQTTSFELHQHHLHATVDVNYGAVTRRRGQEDGSW